MATFQSKLSALAAAARNGGQREPGSRLASKCPAQPPIKTEDAGHPVGEGTRATGKRSGAPRATGPDDAWRTCAGPLGTPGTHAAGNDHGAGMGPSQEQLPGAANQDSAQHTHSTTTQEAVLSNTKPGESHPSGRSPVTPTQRSARKEMRTVGCAGLLNPTKQLIEACERENGGTTMGARSGNKRYKSTPYTDEELGQEPDKAHDRLERGDKGRKEKQNRKSNTITQRTMGAEQQLPQARSERGEGPLPHKQSKEAEGRHH